MRSPTSGLKAELRLRASPCVPLTCAHVRPFLSVSAWLRELHATDRRGQTGVAASPTWARLPLLTVTKICANLLCHTGITGGLHPAHTHQKKKKKRNHPKEPSPPHLSLLAQLKCLWGIEEGQRRQTVSKQACVQTIRKNVCETYSPPEPRVRELMFVSSRRWHVSARGRETRYVRFK